MWKHYRYTDPIAEALTAEFGTSFALMNTGGGCICLHADLEGGYSLLVGSGVDGPLLCESERDMPYGGGFGVGVYDESAPWTGRSLSYAVDHRAETADDVAGLIRTALGLVSRATDEIYVMWERGLDGSVREAVFHN